MSFMRKILILSIFVSLLTLCSSCGTDTEQQAATNENGLALAEQAAEEEYESESTTTTAAELSTDSNNITEDVTTTDKSSGSETKVVPCDVTDGDKTSASSTETESRNTTSTANNTQQGAETTVKPESGSTAAESYEQRTKAEYDAILENAITDQPYNEVLKSTVSDDIILRHLDDMMNPWLSNIDTLLSMNRQYPTELIRKIDNTMMYSIQKPESGGLFYSFYVNGVLQCTAYITKTLSFADYSSVKIGSSVEDVIAIEPATQAYINRNEIYDSLSHDGVTADTFKQHIILKDGLLKLTYSRNGDTDTVKQIEFFDDFKESVDYGMGFPFVYDYRILPEDYPE